MPSERLQKLLARAGIGSRRACEAFVADGRVTVNGRPATLGDKADPAKDVVAVDGVEVPLGSDLVHYALHKPTGVVSTASDPRGRPVVVDLVPAEPRVFPVGRLDIDTSGLLLLTNDGSFANRVAHPRYEIPKTYVVEVAGRPSRGTLARLRKGVELEDGMVRADSVRVLGDRPDRSLIEVVVHSGRNRMVRRLFEAVGHPVQELVRTRIGPIELGRLKPGRWRTLARPEVMALLRSGDAATERPGEGDGP